MRGTEKGDLFANDADSGRIATIAVKLDFLDRFVNHRTANSGVEAIISGAADVLSREIASASLTQDNFTGANRFVVINFNAKAFRDRVAA